MVLLGLNLRPGAAAVGPLVHRIRADTGLSSLGAGLLTALPVFCFGGIAPLAPLVARRIGTTRTVIGALLVLLAGLLVRLIAGIAFLFLGTALVGAAIAMGNVLLPVLARRNFSERTGLITSLYSTAMVAAAAVAAAVAVPVADALGGGWRGGLAVWAAPALAALLVWVFQFGREDPVPDAETERIGGALPLLHDRIAWALAAFFAIQSAGFYATLAWLPSIFQSHGASEAEAGALLGVSLFMGIASSLIVPGLAARANDQRALVVISTACIALGWVGILLAPMSAPYVWAVLLGIGQQALLPLVLTMIVLRGGTVTSTAGLSTLVQSIGYLLASLAPLGLGALHGATGSWTGPTIVLLCLLFPQVLIGLVAGRRGQVTPSQARRTRDLFGMNEP